MHSDPKVLIAEDNVSLRRIVEFSLCREGFETVTTCDGKVALAKARGQQFDLVITDQQMPMLTGVELCRELRQLEGYHDTPLVLLTAKAFELNCQKLKEEIGIARVLRKPFSPIQLSEIAHELLVALA